MIDVQQWIPWCHEGISGMIFLGSNFFFLVSIGMEFLALKATADCTSGRTTTEVNRHCFAKDT